MLLKVRRGQEISFFQEQSLKANFLFFIFSIFVLCCGIVFSKPIASDKSAETILQVKEMLDRKNVSGAILLLKSALSKDPENSIFWGTLGKCYELNGKTDEAIDSIKKAVHFSPDNPEWKKKLEELEAKQRKVAGLPEKGVYVSPKSHLNALFKEVRESRTKGNFEEAFRKFIQCVEEDSGFLAGGDDGTIKEGIAFFQKKLKAGDKNAHFFLALYTDFSGDAEAAQKSLQTFLAGNPPKELAEKARQYLSRLLDRKKTAGSHSPTGPKSVEPSSSVKLNIARSSQEVHPQEVSAPPDDPTLPNLIENLGSKDPEVFKKALWEAGFRRSNSEKVISILIESLNSNDDQIVIATLEAFGKIGPNAAAAVPAIIDLVEKEKMPVSYFAILALGKMKVAQAETIPCLEKCLANSNRGIVESAAQGIVKFGSEALPHLSDPERETNAQVKKYLKKIISAIKTGKPLDFN